MLRKLRDLPSRTRVVTGQQMRDLDARATDQFGIPSLLLMENAGRAVAEAAMGMLREVRCSHVLVVCGPGNNGGDGFVAARHLYNAGAKVTIAFYGDRAKAKGDALANIVIIEKMLPAQAHPGSLNVIDRPSAEDLDELLLDTDLVIDALLGTGVKGELREPYVGVIEAINNSYVRCPCSRLCVDIPSGLDADTGRPLGPVVQASTTVTFALPKIGLLTYPGAKYVGNLLVADISIPKDALFAPDLLTYLISGSTAVGPIIKTREPDANKGSFGHVAIVAGSVGMTGAAALAAEGALKTGAGLVTVAVPESLNDIMEVKLTEAMTIPVPQGRARAFGMDSVESVLEIIEKRDAAVIGPGFGRDEDTIAFTLELVRRLIKPAIMDADALYAISTDLSVLKQCKAPLVITPHPGEMARLLGTTVPEVQSNRLEIARSFAQEHGIWVALKGAGTIVANPQGEAYINITGTPGMASGGTGDVLSGMIGALLARMKEPIGPDYAVCGAVYLHGRAGEIAAEQLGEESMLASDLANAIPDVICEARRENGEE